MKRRLILTLALALLVVLGSGVALAATSYALSWWTAPGGGGASSGTGYSLSGAAGQSDAGRLGGTGYQLSGGFWVGAGVPSSPPKYYVYLPLVVR